jgi:hypothetical protein
LISEQLVRAGNREQGTGNREQGKSNKGILSFFQKSNRSPIVSLFSVDMLESTMKFAL